eukprot:gene33699-43382_t
MTVQLKLDTDTMQDDGSLRSLQKDLEQSAVRNLRVLSSDAMSLEYDLHALVEERAELSRELEAARQAAKCGTAETDAARRHAEVYSDQLQHIRCEYEDAKKEIDSQRAARVQTEEELQQLRRERDLFE